MKTLLTGATGFIGQHILKQLLDDNHKVLCTMRKNSNITKLGESAKKCKWILTDTDDWTTKVEEFVPDAIIHGAWSGVDAANRDNWSVQVANLLFQQQLLDVAAKIGTQRFVGIGSQAEYGTFEGCIDEKFPANPNTAYGTTKLAAMELVKGFCEVKNINWYWFRLFSCFGEGETDNWLIPATIKNMQSGSSMDFTPGEQKYAYLYIGEVAKAIKNAAIMPQPAQNGVYNISSDRTISIKELLEMLRDQVNPNFQLNFGALPYRQGQSMLMQGDSTKLVKHIYKPCSENFENKLEQTLQYYIKKHD